MVERARRTRSCFHWDKRRIRSGRGSSCRDAAWERDGGGVQGRFPLVAHRALPRLGLATGSSGRGISARPARREVPEDPDRAALAGFHDPCDRGGEGEDRQGRREDSRAAAGGALPAAGVVANLARPSSFRVCASPLPSFARCCRLSALLRLPSTPTSRRLAPVAAGGELALGLPPERGAAHHLGELLGEVCLRLQH
jgi:hypothetical protein